MDYLYDPVNAARITAEVQYITPVKGVQDELLDWARDAPPGRGARSLFPPPATTADRCASFANLPGEEEEKFDEKFSEITGA